jgi:histone H3/H4
MYEETRGVLKQFLENVQLSIGSPENAWRLTHTQVLRDTLAYTEHSKRYVSFLNTTFQTHDYAYLSNIRKTATALDVIYAFKLSGRTLYGFGV